MRFSEWQNFEFFKVGVLRISYFCVSVYYIEHELRLAMPKLLQSRLGPVEHFQIKWGTSSVQPKPGFGIGNRNQDQVSVSVSGPELFLPKPKLFPI